MPLSKQAIKKMRHDRKVTVVNNNKETAVKKAVKAFRKSPSLKLLTTVFSLLDKSVKTHNIHKNKASRLKSRLSKIVPSK